MQELVPGISGTLDPTAAGLLIECRAKSDKALDVSAIPLHPNPSPSLLARKNRIQAMAGH